MSQATVLYRFRIDLSDVDRSVYEQLDFRLALHPSESMLYFLTRALAFCLSAEPDLQFSAGGLADPDGPTLFINKVNGGVRLWIEIGNPSIKKLHKAAKASDQVQVYTYKEAQLILNEAKSEHIHNSDQIQIFAFDPKFLERLAKDLPRDIRWNVLYNDRVLTVTHGEQIESCEVKKFALDS